MHILLSTGLFLFWRWMIHIRRLLSALFLSRIQRFYGLLPTYASCFHRLILNNNFIYLLWNRTLFLVIFIQYAINFLIVVIHFCFWSYFFQKYLSLMISISSMNLLQSEANLFENPLVQKGFLFVSSKDAQSLLESEACITCSF